MSSHAPTTSGSSQPHAPPHNKAYLKSDQERTHASTNPEHQSPEMEERNRVQFTGYATAYLRAAENARPDRIVEDPFAEKLAGDVAAQFQSLLSRWGPSQDSVMDMLAIRTRYLDEALAKRNSNITQIVNLACGMDSRAFRLDALSGCHVFEIDESEEMLSHKQRVFQESGAQAKARNVEYIVADLANDMWEQQLTSRGFDAKKPTFWIMEGLLYYLDRSSIVKLLKTVDAQSATGSQLWVDMCGESTVNSEQFGHQMLKFGENNPIEGILSLMHWNLGIVASLGEPGTFFGREWTPIPLSSDSDEVLTWSIVEGSKPAHANETPEV